MFFINHRLYFNKFHLQSPKLSSIFALFVVAGFPEVLSIGSHVKYTDVGTEVRCGVVLKHFPDKSQTLLVDKKSRKRRMVRHTFYPAS